MCRCDYSKQRGQTQQVSGPTRTETPAQTLRRCQNHAVTSRWQGRRRGQTWPDNTGSPVVEQHRTQLQKQKERSCAALLPSAPLLAAGACPAIAWRWRCDFSDNRLGKGRPRGKPVKRPQEGGLLPCARGTGPWAMGLAAVNMRICHCYLLIYEVLTVYCHFPVVLRHFFALRAHQGVAQQLFETRVLYSHHQQRELQK